MPQGQQQEQQQFASTHSRQKEKKTIRNPRLIICITGLFFFYDSILVEGRANNISSNLFFFFIIIILYVSVFMFVESVSKSGRVEVRAEHWTRSLFLFSSRWSEIITCQVSSTLSLSFPFFFFEKIPSFFSFFIVQNTYLEQIANVETVTDKHVVCFS